MFACTIQSKMRIITETCEKQILRENIHQTKARSNYIPIQWKRKLLKSPFSRFLKVAFSLPASFFGSLGKHYAQTNLTPNSSSFVYTLCITQAPKSTAPKPTKYFVLQLFVFTPIHQKSPGMETDFELQFPTFSIPTICYLVKRRKEQK